jgi:leucyl/phenylalanyl-tRNA---protein transferase
MPVTFHPHRHPTMKHPLLSDDTGLLCISDMTDPIHLLNAYRFGVFPWHNEMQYGIFYFPKLRYIIKPNEINIQKSMRTYFNNNKFEITFDRNFFEVMYCCKTIERKENSTWISNEFIEVYTQLHHLGFAHSVEVWQDDILVGGLYGVAVGKVFTGESMFSNVANASKFALICLAKKLDEMGYEYIDCQVINPYLEQFKGKEISNTEFFEIMKKNIFNDDILQW